MTCPASSSTQTRQGYEADVKFNHNIHMTNHIDRIDDIIYTIVMTAFDCFLVSMLGWW